MRTLKIAGLIAAALFTANAYAWTGYDSDAGADIEIDAGTLVRQGETIDFYDHNSGDYKTGDVESINQAYGSGVEVEVYDHDSGEYRTFEMEED